MSLYSTELLYEAYRKAKADLFFERSMPNARKFAEYEEKLQRNIEKLSRRLNNSNGRNPWFEDLRFIGGISFIPKSLSPPKKEICDEPVFMTSNAADSWCRIFKRKDRDSNEVKRLEAEFRPMGELTVDMHVVCALWINLVGHKLDACLDKSARGSRLRRVAGKREYHKTVWQSFEPYFRSYKKWRNDGFDIVRREVKEGHKVLVMTLDFKSFFHKIDPNFLVHDAFLTEAQKSLNTCTLGGPVDSTPQLLSPEEHAFTQDLIKSFETLGKGIPGFKDGDPVGLPVGATASRLIANVFLLEFDKEIQRKLNPLYYARYVDDIFLVIRDNGMFHSADDVLEWLLKQLEILKRDEDNNFRIGLSYGENSKVIFQRKKQRSFLVDSPDLLDAIKSKLDEVSSEIRLLPDLKQLETSVAAKTLATTRDGASDADSLRKADTLLLRRLGLSILLRNANAIDDALPSKEWKNERREFFEFTMRHVFSPDKFFDLFDYLPRLFGLAVRSREWTYANDIFKKSTNLLRRIEENYIANVLGKNLTENDRSVWDTVRRHLIATFSDALLMSSCCAKQGEKMTLQRLFSEINQGEEQEVSNQSVDVLEFARKMFAMDLSHYDYKGKFLDRSRLYKDCKIKVPEDLGSALSDRKSSISKFAKECKLDVKSVMPILFPTRPLTAADISSIANTKSADIRFIKESLNTVRGTIYPISHDLPSDQEGACEQGMLDGDDDYDAMQAKSVVSVGRLASVSQVKIAVTSLKTDSKSWCAAAGRKPDCSAKRFNRIVDLCNSILKASRDGRPDYVLFPELSIPSRWIRTIAETFLKSGISVVAGEEYEHHQGDGSVVDSPARLYLKDDRLGYPTWFILTQLKGKPAHGERDELRSMFGLALRPSQEELSKKFIFSHNGFRFGVLICSELTDVKFREHFRGQVDALFILSWNRDLESFSALVDSTALDVHCFVALVNNRAYGDSRVRVPHKDAWCRDAVRVKGGLTDYFVVAELDVLALRNFQSHLEPPKGPFKPFPEGFDVPDARRVVPGTLS